MTCSSILLTGALVTLTYYLT